MNWTEWLITFLVIQVIHGLGTWKMYVAAGYKAWQAFVPVFNAVTLMKIMNRPWWWTILLFLPVVNIMMFIVVWVDTLRSFGYNKPKDTFLGVVTLGFYIYYINYTQPLNHIKERELNPRTAAGEWTNSILFAVIAATIVHTYVMQPFIIPTSSLEKTLLTGDFLFVSKFHYGARLPMTPIAAPMVHDTIPIVGVKSYLQRPQLPYMRLPGFQKIERNDIVVFNFPADSTNTYPYDDGKYYYKPIDKKSNYVKRCVAIAGDKMSMKDGDIFINGELLILPERAKPQFIFDVVAARIDLMADRAYMIENYDITETITQADRQIPNDLQLTATEETVERLKNDGIISSYKRRTLDVGSPFKQWRRDFKDPETAYLKPNVFPYDGRTGNNNEDRAEFIIPAEGMTVDIDQNNIAYFERIIEVYEGSEMNIFNDVTYKGNEVFLNGKPLTSYTFKQDYYWLMGDNRGNSLDSRFWGYVPFNHVVGKPVFVWMSYDSNKSFPNGFRFGRMFTTVNGSGQPTSYLVYFLVLLAGYFVVRKIMKNKKENKEKS
ncbi:signal peptidase I [Nonlabens dokdonensis]|jgi:signal peptidase I|uniref:Signal peptidase I n=2 Tax=Nonlabens dokdonensis TaxID=328515 RepID=L7WDG5_NONDD|nr:signal peptidase I [Nonlabens dokdonensis]AGC77981.1 putative signal peptidase [Nonlabens dokdonensis DSW-6]PZX37052.1 signal peptidase I [Nonlabens dokdonensis]